MKKSSKLFRKIVIGIIGIILLPMLVVGEISIRKSENVLENNLKTTSIQTIKEVDKGFSEYFEILSTQMNILSKNSYIKDLGDPKANHEATVKYVQGVFKDTSDSIEGVLNVYYGGEYGEFVLPDKIQTVSEFNYKERSWYKDAKESGGKIIYTKPYKDAVTGKQVMTVAQAVKDEKGQVIGVIGVDMSLDSTKEYIDNIKLLSTGYVLLVDKEGTIIVNNDNNKNVDETIQKLPFWEQAKNEDRGVYSVEQNGNLFYACQ